MVYLGEANALGIGTKIDLEIAEEWYLRAARTGSVVGTYELGRFFLDLKRFAEAAEAFRAGVEKDDPSSMRMLAVLHLEGKGVEKDLRKARSLLETAVVRGNVFAKRSLGLLLIFGGFGLGAVLRGGWLIISGLKDVAVVSWGDPTNDRLR
jgi:hypothetical protein